MLELVESLRDAVLLRIPDKYLDAIGVQEGRERQSEAPTPPTLNGSASSARPGRPAASVGRMLKIVVALLILWVVLSIVGFVIEGLLWLAVVGLVLFAATVVWGWLKRRTSSAR